jgi:hypothetical protein
MMDFIVKLLALEKSTADAGYVLKFNNDPSARGVVRRTSIHIMSNTTWIFATGSPKKPKSSYLSIKDHRDTISKIDKLRNKISQYNDVDWNLVAKDLVRFDVETKEMFGLMNSTFILFYLFRVHELLTMLPNNSESMIKFAKLLKKLGQLDRYNDLFDKNVSPYLFVDKVNLPTVLLRIVLDYSELSIYNPDDVAIISERIESL